jgi:hypothetical protein
LTAAETLAALADVARDKGIRSVHVYDNSSGMTYRFVLGPMPVIQTSGPTIRPISVPNTETDDAVRATKRKAVAAYLDAVECAHISGYPNLSDYGLVPGDV